MINRLIIFQTEHQIVFQLINTEQHEIKLQILQIFPNIEPFVLSESVRCPDLYLAASVSMFRQL